MKPRSILLCLFASLGLAFGDNDLTVTLSPGSTSLFDIGLYRVGYQSYGSQPNWMPESWYGHFDPATGISCLKWNPTLGRETLLLHSPWRVPAGKTWVDYKLALPAGQTARFSFGITMEPESILPGRSDGVTFSVYLTVDGTQKDLMHFHQDQAKWKDYDFDFTPYAGKTVTLRLQVEPGPKNDASFDYSLFGNPTLTIGTNAQTPSAIVDQITQTHAYKALEKVTRVQASNSAVNGVVPSNILPAKNTLEQEGNSWRFTYKANDCTLVYTYTPATGTLDDFSVQIDSSRPFKPGSSGEATAMIEGKGVSVRGGKPVSIKAENGQLHVLWQYDLSGHTIKLDWTYQIIGKALAVTVRCDNPIIGNFSLGRVIAPIRKTISVPYLLGDINYLSTEKVFVCRFFDWTKSNASSTSYQDAIYEPLTDGSRNSLFETGYIAVSPDVSEVLPNLPHPPSPFLSTLGPCIMLDIWGHESGYAGDAAKLREFKDNGIDHLVIIQHDWQRFGYDVKLPDHFPANSAYGTEADLAEFGKAAKECGYLWSLHENYIDLYPDAPSYDASARVLRSDGTPCPAWYNPGTKVQSFGLKCNRALEFAKQNSPEIHRRYGTTAAYLDVHSSVPPWHQLDHQAGQPLAGMARAKIQNDTQLFQFERDTHQGPMFGEGHYQFYWAGRCDGVEGQVDGGEDHAPFLDFELLKVHPQMVNHGMGYYERWYRNGYNCQYGIDAGSTEQWDKYRAMEIAYGHAGFIGNVLTHDIQFAAREHHLMHPVQQLYGTAKPEEILYEINGRLVTASAATVVGNTSRQRIRYNSGLTVWVNWSNDPWTVKPDKHSPVILPQWGFLALGPKTEVHTAFVNGKLGDYAECPEYLFVDSRTHLKYPYGGAATHDIQPSLSEFKYLGENRIQVTYKWVVNDTLDKDYTCFIHGLSDPDAQDSESLLFQGDHSFSTPTSQWRPGDVIIDGPHEIKVNPTKTEYDLIAGLYKDSRLPLKGCNLGNQRIFLAHLTLEKKDGKIINISANTSTNRPSIAKITARKADFSTHINPIGTSIDFGKVTTDGAVKINREANRLIIFPYPREREFTLTLDMKALAPTARLDKLNIHGLAIKTQRDLGMVNYTKDGHHITLKLGAKDVGRYVISW